MDRELFPEEKLVGACRKCGGNEWRYEKKGDHLGEYCAKCDQWQRWVKQNKGLVVAINR